MSPLAATNRALPAGYSSAVGRTEGEFFSDPAGERERAGKPGKLGGGPRGDQASLEKSATVIMVITASVPAQTAAESGPS